MHGTSFRQTNIYLNKKPFWSDAQSKSEILKLIINNYKLKTLCSNKLKVGSFDMLHKNLLHYA